MTLLDILAFVLPPAAAFAYNSYTKVQRTRDDASARLDLMKLNCEREDRAAKTAEERAAITQNADELQALKATVAHMHELQQEQQLTLNRIADRF